MNSNEYALKLEKKLVKEFKMNFQSKLGYVPMVITRDLTAERTVVPCLSLEDLIELMQPFLLQKDNKVYPLGTKKRYRECVELRSIFCYLARQMDYSLNTIGQKLGKRDHSTVLHALKLFNALIETDEAFKTKFAYIQDHVLQQIKKKTNELSALDSVPGSQDNTQPVVLPGLLPVQDRTGQLNQCAS